MSNTVFFAILLVGALLCYVFGGKEGVFSTILLALVVVVGLRIHATTDSILSGILAAIVAGPVFVFFGWLGHRAAIRRRVRRYLADTPEGQADMAETLQTLLSYGRLDGSQAQRETADHLLGALSYGIEREPGFTIDRAKARTLLHGLEPRQPNTAFAVLYSLAASTTHHDPSVFSEETQIAASEFWSFRDDFLRSQVRKPQERMLIEMLMFRYFFFLESLREQQQETQRQAYSAPANEPAHPKIVFEEDVPF